MAVPPGLLIYSPNVVLEHPKQTVVYVLAITFKVHVCRCSDAALLLHLQPKEVQDDLKVKQCGAGDTLTNNAL